MFSYSQNDLYCEQVPLADLAARVGTPAYVYSSQSLLANYRAYDESFGDLPHTVCYAVKANSSLAVLALLAKAGAGFDIVSGGELFRVLQAGGDPAKVVFSGVGQDRGGSGIRARQRHPQLQLRVGSGTGADRCHGRARVGVKAGFLAPRESRRGRRYAPLHFDGAQQTQIRHRHGGSGASLCTCARDYRNLAAEGVSCHIGSQMLDPSPILEAVDRVLALAADIARAGRPHQSRGFRRRAGRGLSRRREGAGHRDIRGEPAGAPAE